MTYCVGLRLSQGLVFMSDTRTNAGVDNFSITRKMFSFSVPGERAITLMTAGNLATTQALISLLRERSETSEDRKSGILHQPTMFQVASLVGATLKEVIAFSGPSSGTFSASVIVGGQIKGGPPTIFMIYPEGNFIELTDDAPFLQIGETKYGKPILVRAYDADMSYEYALKLLLVSFASTVKSNLSVGMPFDVQIYENDTYTTERTTRIESDDPVFCTISDKWGDALKTALNSLPGYKF